VISKSGTTAECRLTSGATVVADWTSCALPYVTDLSALVDALEALRRKPAGREPQPAAAGEAPGTDAPAARVPAIESGFALTEATIDEITRRVLERLAPGAVSPVVTDVITKVAERLLREEIARLKT